MTAAAPARPSAAEARAAAKRDRTLAAVAEVVIKRQAALAAVAQVDLELRKLVQAGFKAGIDGPTLAEAAGVSVPRIYQIRDGRR